MQIAHIYGMKLSEWLHAENLTLVEFAKQVGATHSTVSRWCRGEIFPQTDKLVAIRTATKGAVSADDFMPPTEAAD